MKITAGMMLREVEVSDEVLVEIETALGEATQKQHLDETVRVPAEIHLVTAIAV